MASRPVPRIGITTYREPARWGVWQERADLLPETYARSVEEGGALPVLLPPAAPDLAAVAIAAVDGVVVAGGPDVDPGRYAAERDPRTGPARPDRDAWEVAVVRAALVTATPLLAICRGMQVLNVVLGGTLIQDLPDRLGTDLHSPTPGRHGRHRVDVAAGSRLARALGAVGGAGLAVEVATYHHQAVDRMGDGLTAVAWAGDGVVEAVELAGDAWVVGVQWHPETHGGDPLFSALAGAALAGVPA